MPITAVVTADSGPGLSVTAQTINNVASISIEPDKGTFTLFMSDGSFRTFSTSGVGTCTVSISGDTWTITIS